MHDAGLGIVTVGFLLSLIKLDDRSGLPSSASFFLWSIAAPRASLRHLKSIFIGSKKIESMMDYCVCVSDRLSSLGMFIARLS